MGPLQRGVRDVGCDLHGTLVQKTAERRGGESGWHEEARKETVMTRRTQ